MTIDPKRVKEIFLEAADLADTAARVAYLATACAGDAELRQRVEALLHAHDAAGSFLGTPAAAPPATDPTGTIVFSSASDGEPDPKDTTEALTFLAPPGRPGSLGRIGHYEVLQVLGRGGFGIVLRASDEVLQRVVAIKVMAPEIAATSPARKRFLREARSSAQVRHENVVQVYEIGEQPLPFLVMEFIPGETLQQHLDRTGPLELREVLRIGRQIAEGLAAAHAQGLIHRDIKPGNILLESGPRGHAKITDFGLARAADDASLTQSGVVAGTPMYMAPEQAQGEALDHRADLFSLGSVLYQMVSGRPPFRASSTVAVLQRVALDTPRPIREIIPETPGWLCDVIARLHAKNPAARYQSARELADLLADYEARLQADAKLQAESAAPRSKPASAKKRKALAAAALVLLPVLALGATELAGITHLVLHEAVSGAGWDPYAADRRQAAEKVAPARVPADDAWLKKIGALPAEQRPQAVAKKLSELNPGFDGRVGHFQIEDGEVTELTLLSDLLADISPLRALPGLKRLDLNATPPGSRALANLAPLKGMKLTYLSLRHCNVADLTPLEGMPLVYLDITNCPVEDLTPLKGMPLTELYVWWTRVRDLSPLKGLQLIRFQCRNQPDVTDYAVLKGMPLTSLDLGGSGVTDLAPFMGMKLDDLHLEFTQVRDLSPLTGMPLTRLNLAQCAVTDLGPLQRLPLTSLRFDGIRVKDISALKGMPLRHVSLDFDPQRHAALLRAIPTLETINDQPAKEFLK